MDAKLSIKGFPVVEYFNAPLPDLVSVEAFNPSLIKLLNSFDSLLCNKEICLFVNMLFVCL